jgi:transcriptional regulator with XRE-family HTH domain
VNSIIKQPEIRNEAFTKAREKLGLSVQDLAGQACLSARQIEQIENGEMSSFYGTQIKVTAARKVARLLGLSEQDAFNLGDVVIDSKKEIAPMPEESHQLVVAEKKQSQESEPEKKQNIKVARVNPAFAFSNTEGSNSQQSGKQRVFIWLSLIAAVVFSVINLRPLFFADKPQEIVVKEEVLEQPLAETKSPEAPPPSPMAAAPMPIQAVSDVAAAEVCPIADVTVSSYKPTFPKKSADLVYIQAKTKQVVCVVDASGKTQQKTIDPNAGVSFYGAPPFKVLSAGLAQVDVYFQGAKVRPANLAEKTILLEAGDISQPATPSDSQLR